MGPEVADETNPGLESSLTCGAHVGGNCNGSGGSSGFACCAFHLGLCSPSGLGCTGTNGEFAVPLWVVQGE